MMGKKNRFMLVFCLLLLFFSCKSYFIIEDSYQKKEKIIIQDYLFQISDNKVLNAPDNIGDSLFSFFKSHLLTLDLPIKIIDGGENKVDYFFLRERYTASSFRAVDTAFITNMVKPKFKDSLVLIPFIEIFNQSIGSVGGATYSSKAYIQIFIVNQGKIIYRKFYQVNTDTHFEPNPKNIKRNINTKEDWEKAINGAMKEYINRLE